MAHALIIRPDGTTEDMEEVNYQTLRDAVGGWIQMIHLDDGNHMYLDEEGKLKRLVQNPAATWIARDILFVGDFIAGSAVLVGPVQNDDHLPLSDEDLTKYRNIAQMHFM